MRNNKSTMKRGFSFLTILFWVMLFFGVSRADFSRDNTMRIVTDNNTTLQWQDSKIDTTVTWQDAIDRCETLVLGGYNDWRLPNINELLSLVDVSKTDSTIDAVFVNTTPDIYWSSTTTAFDSSRVWTVNFAVVFVTFGNSVGIANKNSSHYVRCVRSQE